MGSKWSVSQLISPTSDAICHFLYFFQNFLIREHRMKLSLLGAFHFPYLTAVAVSEQSHFLGLHPHMPQHVHQHSIPINSSFCLVPLVPLSSYFDIVWWPQLSFHAHLTLTFPFLSPKPIICKPFRSSAVGSSLRMPTWQLGSLLVYPIILPGEACIHTILLLSSFKSFPVFNCPVLLFSLLSLKGSFLFLSFLSYSPTSQILPKYLLMSPENTLTSNWLSQKLSASLWPSFPSFSSYYIQHS